MRESISSAIASIIGGSLVAVYVLTHKNPMGLYSGFWSLLVSLVILVVVTLIVPSKEETFLPDTVTSG
jgi:Na+/proline symporter